MVTDGPAGPCWLAACAHSESHPKRDKEIEKQEDAEGKQEANKEGEVQDVAERPKEVMTMKRSHRIRSETQVWKYGWRQM